MSLQIRIFILLSMIFCHIIDDYYLQGILAQLKQKKWWIENAPDKKYKCDYLMALFMHSFSWSFMINSLSFIMSIFYNMNFNLLLLLFIFNIIIHMFIDDLKANKFKINLIQDQSIHLLQILISWILIYFL